MDRETAWASMHVYSEEVAHALNTGPERDLLLLQSLGRLLAKGSGFNGQRYFRKSLGRAPTSSLEGLS